MNKVVKHKLLNGLADLIINKNPYFPCFREFKLWIKKQNSQYVIYISNHKEILMLETYIPMSHKIDNILCAQYLNQILTK